MTTKLQYLEALNIVLNYRNDSEIIISDNVKLTDKIYEADLPLRLSNVLKTIHIFDNKSVISDIENLSFLFFKKHRNAGKKTTKQLFALCNKLDITIKP